MVAGRKLQLVDKCLMVSKSMKYDTNLYLHSAANLYFMFVFSFSRDISKQEARVSGC